jgi:tetratricopeptide (TPR) repeat protein
VSGRYGMSFAAEKIEQGDYDGAVEAATATIEQGQATAETFLERATAHELLESYDAALDDFEKALAMNAAEKIVDQDDVDDRYFSALVAAGQSATQTRSAGAVDAAVRTIDRYGRTLGALGTAGRHAKDAADWRARFRGELPSLLDKTI